MPTPEQIQQEKAQEAKLNNLSENIIGYTAWGKFYGLMRGAAAAGEGLVPHKVCVSPDGREVKVYKGDLGKIVGSFLKPVHEYISKDLSQGKYVEAFLSATTGWFGQVQNFQSQKNAICFDIKPSDVINLVNSNPNYDPRTGLRINQPTTATTDKTTTQKINELLTTKNILITAGIIGTVAGLIFLIRKI